MRRIVFGGASSLDSYFARPDHSVDWLRWSDEVAEITGAFWKTIDTVIMGRKTFEVAEKSGQGGGYPGVKNYVFSRTMTDDRGGAITIIRDDAAGFVRRLKEQSGKDICLMGGGDFARTLFEANLIDEVGLNIHPVLLGQGIPAFYPMSRQIDLQLRESRVLSNGCVYVTYRVVH